MMIPMVHDDGNDIGNDLVFLCYLAVDECLWYLAYYIVNNDNVDDDGGADSFDSDDICQ